MHLEFPSPLSFMHGRSGGQKVIRHDVSISLAYSAHVGTIGELSCNIMLGPLSGTLNSRAIFTLL